MGEFNKTIQPILGGREIKSNPRSRINFALTYLLVFVVLFVFSSGFYMITTGEFSDALFFLLALIFGGLSLAFLIIILSLVFLRILNK